MAQVPAGVVFRPHYTALVDAWATKPIIKVLIGLRRTGKSVLLRQIAARLVELGQPSPHIFDMESMENDGLRTAEALYERLRVLPVGSLLIDEVQEIAGWERAAASLLGAGWDIWLTGSNAHLLSSELGTLLTGRYVELPVFPLSLPEFRSFRAAAAPSESEDPSLEAYFLWGGLPGLHALGLQPELCREYLRSVFESILLKDVVARFAVRNVALLERLARFVASSVGSPVSALSIAKFLKSQRLSVSVETVQSYLLHLESALLVYCVRRWDLRGKRYLEIGEKFYLGDTGLFLALLGRPGDVNAVLENLVFLELKRRGYRVSVGKIGAYEVDFVAERDGDVVYLQVAYLLHDSATLERELRPLLMMADHHPKRVISMDRLAPALAAGVKHIEFGRFLEGEPLAG